MFGEGGMSETKQEKGSKDIGEELIKERHSEFSRGESIKQKPNRLNMFYLKKAEE